MMKLNNYTAFTLTATVVLLAMTGCKKFLDPAIPESQIQTDRVFSSDETATAAVAGVYSSIGNSLSPGNGVEAICSGLSSDELILVSPSPAFSSFATNSLMSDNAILYANCWLPVYTNLYRINAVLAGLESSTRLTPEVRSRLRGQMLITRAMLYEFLDLYFGNAPLITGTDYEANAVKGNSMPGEIMTQILLDLQEGESLIAADYRADQHTFPDRLTATSLLARTYLHEKQWQQAEMKATEVIRSNEFGLESDPAGVFATSSGETIWQLGRDNDNTVLAKYLLPVNPGGLPPFGLRAQLIDEFETGDRRRMEWINVSTVNGEQYFYPAKYKNIRQGPVTEYYVLVRFAELYLIRAEARAQQHNVAGALADLNRVRERARIPALDNLSEPESVAAIAKERITELFMEGHRWPDLKRRNELDARLSVLKGSVWQSTDGLYPFPQVELKNNIHLKQNAGY